MTRQVLKSVFRVTATTSSDSSYGTCFLVHSEGANHFFLTARHVVGDLADPSLEVKIDVGGIPRTANVVKRFDVDAALLSATGFPITGQTLPIESEIHQQMNVLIYGFPDALEDNHIHKAEILGGPNQKGEWEILFETDYRTHLKGLSGGPVVDKHDHVIGILVTHNAQQPQSGTIVAIDTIDTLLDYSQNENSILCYVVLSEAERQLPDQTYKLRTAVEDALSAGGSLQVQGKPIKPEFVFASDIVDSRQEYADAVKAMCQAEIVIFDITDYEPIIMLLMGIRSVTRRGLTLCSLGENFSIGDVIDLPFNIKEVNLMFHSLEQFKSQESPEDIIQQRIKEGMKQVNLPEYLDLPVFDAVRNLPDGHRNTIPYEELILVLCSFSLRYQDENWKNHVKKEFARLREPKLSVRRILDITSSSRLVSHTIYEYIRRVDLCIIDWTEWRPNVFFEMGVRLAVSDETTGILIEDTNLEMMEKIATTDPTKRLELAGQYVQSIFHVPPDNPRFQEITRRLSRIARQCVKLQRLFAPRQYKCDFGPARHEPFQEIISEHLNRRAEELGAASAHSTRRQIPHGYTYKQVNEHVDPTVEVSPIPIYRKLILAARLQDVDSSDGSSPLIYKSNFELQSLAAKSTMERYLVALFYMVERYTLEEIRQNEQLKEDCEFVCDRAFQLLKNYGTGPADEEMARRVRSIKRELRG